MNLKYLWLCGLSMTLSSCRFGNLLIPSSNSNTTSSDKVSGFYVAQPQSLKFYATLTSTIEKDAPTDQIPNLLSKYITNPVALILENSATGLAGLTSPTGTQAFPVLVDSANHLNYLASTTPQKFWQDANCQKYLQISETGTVTQNPGVTPPIGNTYRLSGSIQLTIQVITQFQGDCSPSFQAMHQCYLDSSQCGGSDPSSNASLQAQAIQIFAPWINSQTIQVSDIPNLTNYAYEVSYY